jgi:Zn-dependent M28 family amino/carboxypeptidase
VLKRFYKECGYTVSEHKYRENGINIVAEKKGLDDKIVILGAHFDGVRDYEAADDNGSGTMGVLGAACALADAPTPKHTIRFISFDEEEIGLVGSRAYAAKIIADNEKEKVIGVICADGMTYEPDHHKGGAVLSDAGGLGRAGNKVVSDALQWATANHPLNIKLEPFDDTRSGTDMGSFWEKGIPAVNTGTSMQVTVPFYHQPTDVVSRVQFDYMLRMTKMITHGIYKLAND